MRVIASSGWSSLVWDPRASNSTLVVYSWTFRQSRVSSAVCGPEDYSGS
jgi:hypothetical protein